MRQWMQYLDRRQLVGGSLLIGVAAIVGSAGIALCASAVVGATRLRLERFDVPLSQMARANGRRLGRAARAGAVAWSNGHT